ncbi:MAG TPA: hypothetical protein VGF98_00025 [Candidatus Tumulicola sp.]|jgi:hypothetical protein
MSESKHLEIERGLTDDFSIPSGIQRISFDERLPQDDLEKLGNELYHRPEIAVAACFRHVSLRSKRTLEPITDLEFLRYFPNIRNLYIDLWELIDISGLRYIRSLESFSLGETKTKRHSLRFLEMFPNIRELSLEGHVKGIDAIRSLQKLECLRLRCVTLPDTSILEPLQDLRTLELVLGGTVRLQGLCKLSKLRHLELTMIRKLDDVNVIGELRNVETLHLQGLRNVTELPSLRNLTRLRSVYLETMKGLQHIRGVAEAPSLQKLILIDMTKVDPTSLRCLVGHPTLREFRGGLGSIKRNAYAEALLDLEPQVWLPPGVREKAVLQIAIEDAKRMMN